MRKVCPKRYPKFGGAARRRFCTIFEKPQGGGGCTNPTPPTWARVKPWAWNQADKVERVDSMRWMRSGRLALTSDIRIWVSSAYWVTWASGACRLRSLEKMVNRRGPRTDPWNTPVVIGRGFETTLVPEGEEIETDWV